MWPSTNSPGVPPISNAELISQILFGCDTGGTSVPPVLTGLTTVINALLAVCEVACSQVLFGRLQPFPAHQRINVDSTTQVGWWAMQDGEKGESGMEAMSEWKEDVMKAGPLKR